MEYNKEDLDDIARACMASFKTFARTFFPERFDLPFSENIHDPIFDILDDEKLQRVVIAAPRGIGKTTLSSIVVPARHILFGTKRYIVPVSCTAPSAIEQSENLKSELLYNEDIRKVFGPMESKAFTKEVWDSKSGTRVRPRGAGQQIRGLLYGRFRPDLIILDDLEDPENMDSEDQRKKKKQWFLADVCNSVNRWRKDWRIIVLGTVLHEDSLLVNLLENKNWHSLCLEICDDSFNSKWPEAISNKEIFELYSDLRDQGEVDVFFREYRNMPVPSGEHASFNKNMFKWYDEGEERLWDNRDVENIVLVDVAKTRNVKSAHSAIVCWGVDTSSRKLFFRDCISGFLDPYEIIDEALKMCGRHRARVVGIETTGLEEFVLYPFKNEMIKRGMFLEVISLKARRGRGEYGRRGKGKEGRVAGLIPFYKSGVIYHNKAVSGVLESQLMSFPKARRWDVMDAASYIVEVLEMGLRYFEQDDYVGDSMEVEREFEELEREYEEPVVKRNWI